MARSDAEPRGGAALGGANLLLRFLLELAMLAAFVAWGFRVVDAIWLRVVLGLGAPAIALFVWGAFVAPKAPMRLADPGRLGVEVVLFGLAAAGLAMTGLMGWGIALAVVAALNIAILQALKLR